MESNHYSLSQTYSTSWLDNLYENIQNLDKIRKEILIENFHENIFSMFQIDLEKWGEMEFVLTFKGRLNPETIDNLEFWRVQQYVNNYKEYLKKQKEEEEKSNGKNNIFNQSNLMRDSQKMMGDTKKGMPNISNSMKLPKMNI